MNSRPDWPGYSARTAESEPAFNGGWDEFATGLARILGADISHRRAERDQKLITEITIATNTSR